MVPSSFTGSMAKPYPALRLRHVLIVLIIVVVYLLLSYLLVGLHTEQFVAAGLFAGLYIISWPTRRIAIGFSIFLVYWIIFNYMKAFPNYLVYDVHIADLYASEKSHFGILLNGTVVTPNEYWQANHNTFLDILTGFFYLCWVPVPLMFAVILFLGRREQFFRFSLTFLLVNLVGFVIYYIYPAAPPWYVQQFGFTFNAATPGNTGGLHRFDDFFGAGIFKSLYAQSSNVFAAMPSLHSAYPLIVLYYGIKTRMKKWLNLFFAIVMLGIWFSAVYTSHHYLWDVLAGIACAVFSIGLFHVFMQTKGMRRFMAMMIRATAPVVKLKQPSPAKTVEMETL